MYGLKKTLIMMTRRMFRLKNGSAPKRWRQTVGKETSTPKRRLRNVIYLKKNNQYALNDSENGLNYGQV